MSTIGPIQISQITSILSTLALLWLAVAVPVGMALLWRAHKRLVRAQTAAIVKAVRSQRATVLTQADDEVWQKALLDQISAPAYVHAPVGDVNYPEGHH